MRCTFSFLKVLPADCLLREFPAFGRVLIRQLKFTVVVGRSDLTLPTVHVSRIDVLGTHVNGVVQVVTLKPLYWL